MDNALIVPNFYKYLDISGARATLSKGQIKLSKPSEFNDPFDLNVRNLPGFDLDLSLSESRDTAMELLRTDPVSFAEWCGADPKDAHLISRILPQISEADLINLLETAASDMKPMRDTLALQRDDILQQYDNAAVFCASRVYDNPLMWAHYAEKHMGIVLGFTPNPHNDSILTVLQPIMYVPNPPNIMLPGLRRPNKEEFLKSAMQLYYSKHESWADEKEVRLYIPSEIRPPFKFTLMKFPPDELTDIYLGCRTPEPIKEEMINLAKLLNPHIHIHHGKLMMGSYGLVFE